MGAHTLAGTKIHCKDWINQDAYVVVPLGPDRLFAAVFDGHGVNGQHSAYLARSMFAEQAAALASAGPGMESMFRKLFHNVQAALETQGLARMAGTTATAAIVDLSAGTFSAAYVGDSRLLASLGPRVYFETKDHQFDADAERRCLESGGEVREQTVAGVCARRVFKRGEAGPGLTMSRSLGDTECHELGVIAEPTVHCSAPYWPGCTLVLASDGIWEKLSSEQAATVVAELEPQAAAEALVKKAHAEWHGDVDDITVIVVRVGQGMSQNSASVSGFGSSTGASVPHPPPTVPCPPPPVPAQAPLAATVTVASGSSITAGSSAVRRSSPGSTAFGTPVRCGSPSRVSASPWPSRSLGSAASATQVGLPSLGPNFRHPSLAGSRSSTTFNSR